VHKKLAKNHATALFLYGQGVINPDAEKPLSKEHIEALTGFRIIATPGVRSGMMKILSEKDNPLASRLEPGAIYGDFVRKMWANCSSYMNRIKTSTVNLYPAFATEEGDGTVLARFLDSGLPSISVKEYKGFRSIYYGSKHLNAELAREIARYAGCHVYLDSDDVLYANRNFLCLHASSGGEKTLHLPTSATVREIYSKRIYATNTDTVRLHLSRGETLTLALI
jgi:hypothetical protein